MSKSTDLLKQILDEMEQEDALMAMEDSEKNVPEESLESRLERYLDLAQDAIKRQKRQQTPEEVKEELRVKREQSSGWAVARSAQDFQKNRKSTSEKKFRR